MQPPETTQITFKIPVEHNQLLEQLVEESSIVNNKEQLLRLMIADHTDATGSEFIFSHPSIGTERVRAALEKQEVLIDETRDKLVKDSEVSETVVERFNEIYDIQKEIVDLLRHQ